MKKEELLNEIRACDKEMEDWKNKNDILWKNAYNRRKELYLELDELENPKSEEINEYRDEPKKVESAPKKKEKEYDPADVDRDGDVDFGDLIAVGKKILSKGKKKKK